MFLRDIILTQKWVDSKAFSSLANAIAYIGTSNRTLVIDREEVITSLTIPPNISLYFTPRGSIKNSHTLSIQTKNIEASHQIFTGTGAINFHPHTIVKTSWFHDFETAILATQNDTVTLLVDKPDTLYNNCSVGNNVTLLWLSPNVISIAYGVTLSNISKIESPPFQLFALYGSAISSTNFQGVIYPEWFNSDRNHVAIYNAIEFANNNSISMTLNGDWIISTDITIPPNILPLTINGLVTITSNATLTLNNLSAPLRQIFNLQNDSKVIFANNASEVYPEWWGAVADGSTNCSIAVQKAIDSVANAGGTVKFQAASYSLAQTIYWHNKVHIKGSGKDHTILYLNSHGPNANIQASEKLSELYFGNLTLSHTNNTSETAIDAMVEAKYGIGSCTFHDFNVHVKGITTDIFRLWGYTPNPNDPWDPLKGQPNNWLYSNHFYNFRTKSFSGENATGYVIRFVGSDVTNTRSNANFVSHGVCNGIDNGFFVWGNGNLFQRLTFNTTAGKCFHFKGNPSTYANTLVDIYFDAGVGGYNLYLESTYTGTFLTPYSMCEIFGYTNINPNKIAMVNSAGGQRLPTYTYFGGFAASNFEYKIPSRNYYAVYGGFNAPDDAPDYSGRFVVSGDHFNDVKQFVSRFGGVSMITQSHGAAEIRFGRKLPPPYTNSHTTLARFLPSTKSFTVSGTTTKKTATDASVDIENDTIIISEHGFFIGQPITFYVSSGGSAPGGLTDETKYYIIVVDPDTIKLALSINDAINGTAIDITSTGSGTFNFVTGSSIGSFTCSAATSHRVYNPAVDADSIILTQPVNSAANAYEKAGGRIYVTANDNGYFDVTGDGTAFAGTEKYRYLIFGNI